MNNKLIELNNNEINFVNGAMSDTALLTAMVSIDAAMIFLYHNGPTFINGCKYVLNRGLKCISLGLAGIGRMLLSSAKEVHDVQTKATYNGNGFTFVSNTENKAD